ncbi:MAG: hypothetical protein DRO15_02965 [Thermoprotei archaeon]|nr:MAG: hypothetical protein DRO15_02965 [Thermoprotei archaeon]
MDIIQGEILEKYFSFNVLGYPSKEILELIKSAKAEDRIVKLVTNGVFKPIDAYSLYSKAAPHFKLPIPRPKFVKYIDLIQKFIDKFVKIHEDLVRDLDIDMVIDDMYSPMLYSRSNPIEMDYAYVACSMFDNRIVMNASLLLGLAERGVNGYKTLNTMIKYLKGIDIDTSELELSYKILRGIAVEFSLKRSIANERMRKKALSSNEVLRLVEGGNFRDAVFNLIFWHKPSEFENKVEELLKLIRNRYAEVNSSKRAHYLRFLVELAIAVKSYLPYWNLKNREIHEDKIVSDETLSKVHKETLQLIQELLNVDSKAVEYVMRDLLDYTIRRFRAERVAETEKEAEKFVGRTPIDYVKSVVNYIENSNLMRLSLMRSRGDVITELGNDYAAFLDFAVLIGACFVTSNPVLIKIAWDVSPEFWNKRADDLILSVFSADELKKIFTEGDEEERRRVIERLTVMMTMEIVYENAKLLRDIFLITEGEAGQISLQLNPKLHTDPEAMVREALYVWSELGKKLGGIPNIVFKVPASYAGLKTAEVVTARGIGVNVTVNFGLFQEVRFAEIINKSGVIASYLTIMNGRFAAPVIKELESKGLDIKPGWWSGVAVVKRLYKILYKPIEEGGWEIYPLRIKELVASLRIYDDYYIDIVESIGVPVITVFPHVRRGFDSKEREIDLKAVEKEVDKEILKALTDSEIFKQGYYLPGDSEEFKPKDVIRLEDVDKLNEWPSYKRTITQFAQGFDDMGKLIEQRIMHIISKTSLK